MKTLKCPVPKEDVFSATLTAVKSLGFEIETSSLKKGLIELYSEGGLLSFGNKVTVTLISSQPNRTKVEISSRSAATLQLIDWGTNDDIENDIYEEIRKVLKV